MRKPISCHAHDTIAHICASCNWRANSWESRMLCSTLCAVKMADSHLGVRAVHVARTKGKESTYAMTATMFQAAECAVGLCTPPQLASTD